MKTIYKLTTVVLVAGMALSACTKDITAEKEDVNPQENLRTIEVTFDTPTKSSLDKDGRTPKFDNGDEIAISNGNKNMIATVKVVNGKASFTTDLTGSLKAVYPAVAAKIDRGDIVGVKVPLTQSGFFKDANIAMAEIGITQNKALFKPQTAVLRFYVDNSIGVKSIVIEETNGRIIADESDPVQQAEDSTVQEAAAEAAQAQGQAIGGWEEVQSEGSRIVVRPGDSNSTLGEWLQDRVCYVAILPTPTESESGVDVEEPVADKEKARNGLDIESNSNAYDLSLTSYTFTQTASNGGSIVVEEASIKSEKITGEEIPVSPVGAVTKTFTSVSLPAGTLASVVIPYYIAVNVGTEEKPYIQYWSYCNLGAFLPEEPGFSFSWANTSGYVKDAYGNWVRACGSEGDEYIEFTQDDYENRSHGIGASLQQDIDLYTSQYDAAYYAWRNSTRMLGGTPDDWRMPTKAEVDTLLNKFQAEPGRTFAKEDHSGKQGVWFRDYTGNRVFFAVDSYWTATYVKKEEETSDSAYIFKVEDSGLGTTADYRWYGYHIRPIFGNPLDESTGVRIEPIEEGETL
ncbi:MAG: hypothetical protein MJY55_04390 [Bacteroidales bacterium]|nr:hypothetical protein [Bacteroidales bacterium]